MRARRLCLSVLLLLLAFPATPARARVWTGEEQRVWEDRWREFERSRAASAANPYHQLRLGEAMVAEVEQVQPGDTLLQWVGVLESVRPEADPARGRCVEGTIRLSDQAHPTPHVLRFQVVEAAMTDELEQDLNGVWMGGLVTVTGVVESTTPAVPCLTPSLPSFVDRTWGYFAGFWRRLAGQPTASFATFPRRTKSPPASPEIAVVTIKPNRVDPAWSLERRYVSAELVALEEEAARLQALEEELREWAEGVVVPAIVCAAFQARDQEVGAAEEERVFKFAQLSQALGEGPVQYGVEWQGIECFASIRTGGEAERRRLGAERFYARSRELVKWRNELAEAAAQLRIAKRDLAVLERSALSLPPVGGRGVTTAAAGRSSSGSPGVSPVGCYGALPTPSGGQQHGEARK